MLNTPGPYILIGLVAYFLTYLFYARWVDKKIWETDPNRPTPARLYFDGVEYFPVSKYVLFGYQFKSVAALGPIVGPLTAVLFFGWVPALLWVILGNMFIGWVQDYSAMMMSLRNEGRSMGPITYKLLGDRARKILLIYLIFYLIIITAVFEWVIIDVLNRVPGTFTAVLFVLLGGVVFGALVFRMRMDVLIATVVALGIVLVGYFLVTLVPAVRAPGTNFLDPQDFFKAHNFNPSLTYPGTNTVLFWLLVLSVLYYIAAVTPMPRFLLPTVYVGYLPSIIALVLVLIAAIFTPLTGLTIQQTPMKALYVDPLQNAQGGPLWPILFVTIACGAISGWHSLVSSGLTPKQLEYETDALPVGGGAMMTEGAVALSSIAAVMVLSQPPAGAAAYVQGATLLTTKLLQVPDVYMNILYGIFVTVMGLITSMLFVRVFRLIMAELFEESPLGNKFISPILILIIAGFLAFVGSWTNLWIFFGGTNQLLAGLALLLVAIFLASVKKPTAYVFIPGIFMAITTLAALAWETYVYGLYAAMNKPIGVQAAAAALYGNWIVSVSNYISAAFGALLLILGAITTYYLITGWIKYRRGDTKVFK
ncbi:MULTISPECIES: carbon starvation protein A [Pyrobaculum]|uniref:Carbon starvation protein CstA n=3 Tax=Pyrobaculum TaxID=2276 RepID=A4WJB1_PYRAR|nr:carbon starvation CstA family protein [Pyrobaculum arsenaticum]ABP50478.1 carbon starvation protein CstA [Pyrobaculum arsenaticum DSM 13514]MCY0890471.1 carbon starvation protein A [Pyrobaculum arsenaticum]NYR14581.1 carbon starvation protein A [Pyrobaculum arsenaticum]